MPKYRAAGVSLHLSTTETSKSLSRAPLGGLGNDVARETGRVEAAVGKGIVWNEGCSVRGAFNSGDLDFLGDAPFYCVPMNVAALTLDGPRALALSVQFDDELSFCREKDSHKKSDIKIDVYFNGEFAHSSLIPPGRIGPHVKYVFSGKRIDRIVEAAWLLYPDGTGDTLPKDCEDLPGGLDFVQRTRRWRDLGKSILQEADAFGFDDEGHRPPSADVLQELSRMEMPLILRHAQSSDSTKFGIIDVIITLGEGKKCAVADGYLRRAQRLTDDRFSTSNEPSEWEDSNDPAANVDSNTSTPKEGGYSNRFYTSTRNFLTSSLRPAVAISTSRTDPFSNRTKGKTRRQHKAGRTAHPGQPVKRPEEISLWEPKDEPLFRPKASHALSKTMVQRKHNVPNGDSPHTSTDSDLILKGDMGIGRLNAEFKKSMSFTTVRSKPRETHLATLHQLGRCPARENTMTVSGPPNLPESAFDIAPITYDPGLYQFPPTTGLPSSSAANVEPPRTFIGDEMQSTRQSGLKIKVKMPLGGNEPVAEPLPRLKLKMPTIPSDNFSQPPLRTRPNFPGTHPTNTSSPSTPLSVSTSNTSFAPSGQNDPATQSNKAVSTTPAQKRKLTLTYKGTKGGLGTTYAQDPNSTQSATPLSPVSDPGPSKPLRARFGGLSPSVMSVERRGGIKKRGGKRASAARSSAMSKQLYVAPAFDVTELSRNCLITYASRTDDVPEVVTQKANRETGDASTMDVDGGQGDKADCGFFGGGAYRQVRSERNGRFKETEVLLAVRYIVGLW